MNTTIRFANSNAARALLAGVFSTLVFLEGCAHSQSLRDYKKIRSGVTEFVQRYNDRPKEGRLFEHLTTEPDTIVLADESHAVACVKCDECDPVMDAYVHLKPVNDGGWQGIAVGGFGPARLLGETLRRSSGSNSVDSKFIASLQLWCMTDRELKSWFLTNRKSLDKALALAKAATKNQPQALNRFGDGEDHGHPELRQAIEKLSLLYVENRADGNIEFCIGGILSKRVAFLFSQHDHPPKMDSTYKVIWVEKLAGHWYLLRTAE